MNVVGRCCSYLFAAKSRPEFHPQCAITQGNVECAGDVRRCHCPELRALADERGRAPRPPGGGGGGMSSENAYIAVANCGCVMMAAIETPASRRDVAKEIATCIRKGFIVRHVEVNEIPEWPWVCAQHQAELDAKRAAGGRQPRPPGVEVRG